jgi:hypothetical protein
MKTYRAVEKFIDESFAKEGAKHSHTPIHLKLTVECLKQLKPDADEALLVAALSHDIERSFFDRKVKGDTFTNQDYLRAHQERSAEIITNFLVSINVDDKFIKRVHHLVVKHEVGGDTDQNLLKDADSLSFFKGEGYESIAKSRPDADLRGKIDYMYNRISSDTAKEIANPLYNEAIKWLGVDNEKS